MTDSELKERLKTATKSHAALLQNEEHCIQAARGWPVYELLFDQIQRDMSRVNLDGQSTRNLNAVFFAQAQTRERLLEFIGRGNYLIEKRERNNKAN